MDIDCDLITESAFFHTDKLNGFVRRVVDNPGKCAWTLEGSANVQGNNIVLPADATVNITSKKDGNEGFVLTISTNSAPPVPSGPPDPVKLEDALNDLGYVYPDRPRAVNGFNLGQPGQNFRDHFIDCDAITETATYNIPATVSTMRSDLLNFQNCTVVTVPNVNPSITGNFQRRIIATNGRVEYTNTSTGKTLTVIYASVPAATSTLSSGSARGVVGQPLTPVTLTPVNFTPTGFSIDPELPAGLSIDPVTGEVSGTPTAVSQGQYAITASDGTKQGTGILALEVSETPAYVVTYDQEIGTQPYAVSVTPGQSLPLATTNSLKSNSVFAGWRTEPEGAGVLIGMSGDSYTPTSLLTLYAHWLPRVTITFQRVSTLDPHPVFPPELAPWVNTSNNLVLDFAQDSLITLPVPTRAGNAFLGWTTGTSCPGSGAANVANWRGGAEVRAPSVATQTLRACWTTSAFFDFHPRGGSIAGCTPNQWTGTCRSWWSPTDDPLAASGLPTIVAPTPTRDGHRFDGWFTSISDGTRLGGGGDRVTFTGQTINAQWTQQALNRSAASITGTRNAEITPWTVTPAGFTPDTFSIDPALPAGLTFDTSNGTISGTPLVLLSPAVTHTVTATGADGTATTTVSISVVPPAPLAPTNLRATPGDGQVSLVWDSPANTAQAVVTNFEYSLDDGAWIALNPASTSPSTMIGDLINDREYSIRVRAVNAVGPGAASDAVTATPIAPPPPPTTTVPPAPSPTPMPTPTPTPTPTPGGQLPQVSPGVVQAVIQCPSDSRTSDNGLCDDAPVQVSVVNEDRDLVLKGSDFDLSIAGDCVEDCRITQTEGRQVLELERNGRARVQGSGFEAGSPVYVWLFSEPTLLGTLTVADDGTFAGSAPIGTIDVGEHTLQVSGQSADGRTRALSLGVVVSAPDRYIPLMPERIMDTRAGRGVLQPGEVLRVPVDAVPVDAEAVALNVTVANAEGDGFFTVWPCGGSVPNASNGNFVGINTIAGKVVSGIGEDHSVCVSVGQSVAHVLVDVYGYFPFGSSYEAFSPRRMFDSRESHGMIAADDMVRVSLGDLADDVTAAVVNVTIANATGDGFFTVWDCATQVPATSNGNFVGISTVANKVVTATGADDEICVRVGQASAHVIVDLLGVLHADSHYEVMGEDPADVLGAGRAYEPDRVVDTREDGEPVQAGETLRVELDGVPTGARAVKMNVTVANAQGDGFFTVWPCGVDKPGTSNGNFVGITTIANKVISGIGENHSICIELGQSAAEIIVDLFGFVPAPVR